MQRERVLSLAGRIENELELMDADDAFARELRGFVARVHEPGDLPAPGVYERARRAWIATGPEEDAPRRLLDLLYKLDRALIFAFDLLRFGTFESAMRADARFETRMGRPHEQKLSRASTRFVALQIELGHAYERKAPVTVHFDWRLFAAGKLLHQEIEPITFEPHWRSSWVAQTWGSERAGTWAPGSYVCSAWIWGRELCASRFDVV